MSILFRRSCGAALVYAVATQGAWADLSANDVWSDWKTYMGGMGYEVTGTEATSGNVLTVTDLKVAMEMPEGEGSGSGTLPEVSFTENGDGTVSIDFPAQLPIAFNIAAEGEEPVTGELLYSMDQMKTVVSGTPEEMLYTYTAAGLSAKVTSLIAEGKELAGTALNISIDMKDVAGTSKSTIAEQRGMEQAFTVASTTYNLSFDDPESDDQAAFNGAFNGINFNGSGQFPTDMSVSDYEALIATGFRFAGGFTFDSGSSALSGNGEGEEFAYTSTSQGGAFNVAMDGARIGYDVSQNATDISVTVQDLPFPIDLKMAKAGFKFDFPMQQSEELQPFSMAMNLTDFTMSDMIWGMFDPAGALPRDPATVSLDTTGMAKVLVNFLDPAVAETLEQTGAAPGELHALTINQLLVSMVGAKLAGTGAFEFDNTNTAAFDGMPAPSGSADLELSGANGLIDKLIAMGMMSDSDAMGARMMMGMLAVPGDAPDTLKSTIEINKQGHIIANGQRLK
ncbi:DUF2125 domain-containing protein [Phaeobacter gallaeciensis]|uniref:DUF2125 domain-containing protein n=2 Tax=Roseobacteraceae TaxID=2854170 RepID=A0A366X5H3_9RHOB|nr:MULTISPECIES: DUF2125 domain-containing protein [Roseobacteraceae]MBT3141919.1 DUF2125 domain-containing protein [Falsiruegeria litorea]MBT8168734.1 DUF2125 domain-containing protein [Falsiruegeria litorea]RBW60008.1 DUF2125 domain-containing protein [Phaeobacter gallaeciensis]